MLLFDVGANRGDATIAGLTKGYRVIAIEPGPRIYRQLVANFIYNNNVVPLKFAVSDTDNQQIEFYEAEEDGLSTLNKEWLTDETMPYNGKPYRTINATTITIDSLAKIYGNPEYCIIVMGDYSKDSNYHMKYKEPIKGKGMRMLFRQK